MGLFGKTGLNSGQQVVGLYDQFLPLNMDTTADTKYYGFQDVHGRWYIMKEVTSLGTFSYSAGEIKNDGTGDYATAWTGRAGLTYADAKTTFGE